MPARLNVDFSWSPVSGTPFTWTVGGNTYPYTTQQDTIVRPSDSRYAAVLTSTNTALTFTSSIVVPPGMSAIEYRWNFGDGSFSYGPVVTHTYIAPSPQTAVSLVVTDNFFNQATRQKVLNLRFGNRITLGLPFRVVG